MWEERSEIALPVADSFKKWRLHFHLPVEVTLSQATLPFLELTELSSSWQCQPDELQPRPSSIVKVCLTKRCRRWGLKHQSVQLSNKSGKFPEGPLAKLFRSLQ